MSNSSLNLAVGESAGEAAGKVASGKVAGEDVGRSAVKGAGVGETAEAGRVPEAPAFAPLQPTLGSGSSPVFLVLLLIAAAGFGVFGLVQLQSASVLRAQVSELTATMEDVQRQNGHYENVLTRIRVATGALQASLTELNELASSPVPSQADSVVGIVESPVGETDFPSPVELTSE